MQVVSCYNALKGLVELYLRFNVLFAIEENDKAQSLKDQDAYYVCKLDKDVHTDSYNIISDYTDDELTINIVNVRKLIFDSNI